MLTPHTVYTVDINPTIWQQLQGMLHSLGLKFVRIAPSTLILAFLVMGML